jgi:hypothetical protein
MGADRQYRLLSTFFGQSLTALAIKIGRRSIRRLRPLLRGQDFRFFSSVSLSLEVAVPFRVSCPARSSAASHRAIECAPITPAFDCVIAMFECALSRNLLRSPLVFLLLVIALRFLRIVPELFESQDFFSITGVSGFGFAILRVILVSLVSGFELKPTKSA